MIRRFAAAAALLCLAIPAVAQQGAPVAAPPPAAATPATAPQPATVRVALDTSAGPLVIAVETERAPVTAANFLRYVDNKKLDGATFYRAANMAPGYGLVQFGTRYDPKRTYPPIAHEPTTKTGLTHDNGAISMARAAPGSAAGDFFIVIGEMKSMDADPTKPGDNLGFAAFGHVVEGMDVVHKVLEAPTSPTEGEGVMKGQMLQPAIKITSAKRMR